MTRAKRCVIVASGVLVLVACHRDDQDDTPPPPAPVFAPAVAPAVAPVLAPVEPQPSDERVVDLTISEDSEPTAPLAAGGSVAAQARACSMQGDNACVIRVLEGRAQTEAELAMLIEAYRARGQTAQAVGHMRAYVERFPDTPRARAYRTIIARST
jgi:hypothetical protein